MIADRVLAQLVDLFAEGDYTRLEQFLRETLVSPRGLSLEEFQTLGGIAVWTHPPSSAQSASSLTTIEAAFTACGHDENLADSLTLYLLSKFWEAWEHSWIHEPIDRAIGATVGAYCAQFGATEEDVPLLGLLRLLTAELRTENAAASRSLWAIKDEATRTSGIAVELVRRVPATPVSALDELVLAAARREALYYGLVGSAAEAADAYLTGANPDLAAVIARIELGETDPIFDEVDRSELRAHRYDLESLSRAGDRQILRIDAGRITYQFPFGLSGPSPREAVAAARAALATNPSKIGCLTIARIDSELALNDVWRDADPYGRAFTGAEVHFAPVRHPELAELDSDELNVSVRLSDLGNHCLRITFPVTDILPHQLHMLLSRAALPSARWSGLLAKTGLADGPNGPGTHDPAWQNLCELSTKVISELTHLIARHSDKDLTSSFLVSQYTVITQVHRATGLDPRDFREQRPLDASAMTRALGFEQFLAPCPQGYNSVAEWVSRADHVRAPQANFSSSPGDLLLWNQNNAVLTATSVPLYRVEEECNAVEFVNSLSGLFTGWESDVARYVDLLERSLRRSGGSDAAPEPTAAELATARDDFLAFVTSARRVLLAIDSPTLVSSMAMRELLDRLMSSAAFRARRDRVTRLLEGAAATHLPMAG